MVCGHGSVRGELARLLGAAGLWESRFYAVGAEEQLCCSQQPSRVSRLTALGCTGQRSGMLHDTTAAWRRGAGLPLVLHGYRDADF